MAEPTPVGRSVPRVDGIAKVTGAARYLDDLDLPGAWHGATVRSREPHARLDGIDLDPAFDWTDVVVVTAADIPGTNAIHLLEDDQPALVAVGAEIRHVDEAVALVAAPTRARAMAARGHVRLRTTPLPAVFDPARSAHVFKDFLIRKGHDDDAAFETAMSRAAQVITSRYSTHAQEQMYIEPQAMAATWDGGVCHIVGSMQCPYYIHKGIKDLLKVGDDGMAIAQAVTGGGFGGKEEYPSMIAAHAALLAKKAGHTVKIVYDRAEDIAATTKRHPAVIDHRLGLAPDGTIVAIDVDVLMDGGAYLTLSPVVLSRGVLHAAGPYRCPVVRIRGRVVATNHPPHGAFRGFGAPQTTFPYERQIEKAARARGEAPLAYRKRLALRVGDSTATGQVLDASVGSEEVLAAVERVAGPVPAREGVSAHGAPVRRGRGYAFYFHGAGFTGSGEQRLAGRATVAAMPDGTFEVRSSSTDIGQGATTIFAQLAASGLGVDIERIRVIDPLTSKVPDSGPTVASRTCMVVGGLVEKAAAALRARLGDGPPAEEISETVQYQPPPGIHWDDATYTGSAYPCYGWACCLVDLAVDTDTCEVTVERCVQAIDVGKAINPVIVKGQIEGGTLQALGWALLENVVYKDGRVMNANMTNCIVPTFADAPEMETIVVEVPFPYGPHGAKGVGEIPMDGPAAAVANALVDALGVEFDDLPVMPETIAARRAEWEQL
jgi:CO/xanthine dehydrogenase Mo-binding subunit